MQTPPMLDYIHSDEILTKHKEAIRQLFKFVKIGLQQLEVIKSAGAESSRHRIGEIGSP